MKIILLNFWKHFTYRFDSLFLAFLTWFWIRDWFYCKIDWRSASLAFLLTKPVWFKGLEFESECKWLNGLMLEFASFWFLPFDSSTWFDTKTDVGCLYNSVPPAYARAVLLSTTVKTFIPAFAAANIDYVSCWTYLNWSRLEWEEGNIGG